jgi:uncharacterized membrane protein required for colicin V production
MEINYFDWSIVLFVIFSMLAGAYYGIIKTTLRLFFVAISFIASYRIHSFISYKMPQEYMEKILPMIIFTICFLVFTVCFNFLAEVISRILKQLKIKWVDRTAGSLSGIIIAMMLSSIILSSNFVFNSDAIQKSYFGESLHNLGESVVGKYDISEEIKKTVDKININAINS